jgi:hypothetical protein
MEKSFDTFCGTNVGIYLKTDHIIYSTVVGTQGLVLAKQVLYHLCHAPVFFAFIYFSGMVSCFCLGLASDHNPHTYASCIGGIMDMATISGLFVEMGSH